MALDLASLVENDGSLLHREVFWRPDIYELELEKIFARTWNFLCHESQIPNAGDFFATYIGEDPILVVRQPDGSIRAFLNVCRHRGMKVCRADEGNAKSFMCSYHGWSYDGTGALIGVPKLEKSFNDRLPKEDWPLEPVSKVENYKGLIFGNFDPNAVSFREFLGDMAIMLDLLLDRENGTEVIGGVQKWRIKTNWKIAAENFVTDGMHLTTTHISAIMAVAGPNFDPNRLSALGTSTYFASGHGGVVIDGDPEMERRSLVAQLGPELADHLFDVAEKLQPKYGAAVSNLRNIGSANIFPNLSWLTGRQTLRVWHPKGPNETEVWNWTLVDRDSSEDLKVETRKMSIRAFGPSGIFEQDDAENWTQISATMRGYIAGKLTLPYLAGEAISEGRDTIPGLKVSSGTGGGSEGSGREFYRHWLALMTS